MIFSCYPGVGKTTTAFQNKGKFIDLESSCFNIGVDKPQHWELQYIKVAEHLNNQGYDVFISTHKSVRKALDDRHISYWVIFPSLELKEKWLNKLKERAETTQLVKDIASYKRALQHYDEDITDLDTHTEKLKIVSLNYKFPFV